MFFLPISRLFLPNLANNNLSGSLPSEIQYLNRLETLDLSGNFLEQSIPEELQNLKHLTQLNLSNNILSGQVNPLHWLGHKLTRLETLDLSNNQLDLYNEDRSFNRRESIGVETNLKTLAIGGNELHNSESGGYSNTNSIPDEIRYLTNLQQLSIRDSNVGGRIPAWLFHELDKLEYLDVSHNILSGSIANVFPSVGGSLHLQHLKALLFHDNLLTGTLPESIALMPRCRTQIKKPLR